MKRFLVGAVVLGLAATPAMAGSIWNPMQGTLGNPFNDGQVSGYGWNAAAGGGAGPNIGNLYDNFLTANGGAATAGFYGTLGTIPGTQAFVDWGGAAGAFAQYGDDLHGISAGGAGPAVVTSLRYGYINVSPFFGDSTHTIKIYDMIAPSAGHDFAVFDKGVLLSSIVLPGNPTGAFTVTVTGLNLQLPNSAVWIKLAENSQTLGFPYTFWLTGGAGNGVGTSHPGLSYTLKKNPPYPYNYFVGISNFFFDGDPKDPKDDRFVASNIQLALNGFHIPAPAVMSLLGIGGLVALRRRRR